MGETFRQEEEPINDGLGIFVEQKTLYHGSQTPDIKKFNRAEDTTIGAGVYFTSKAADAEQYTNARVGKEPVLYECLIENMKLLDLRNENNFKVVAKEFKPVLEQKIESLFEESVGKTGKMSQDVASQRNAMKKVVALINSGDVGLKNLHEITKREGDLFSDFVQQLGYEGLVAIEGGEGHKESHDSYVIFDPERVRIMQEQKIQKNND